MTDGHSIMVGAATVFVVSDIAKSVEQYCDRLGFTGTFQYGKPVFCACLCRDEVALHLLAAQETKRIPGNGGICVFVNDVMRPAQVICARGRSRSSPGMSAVPPKAESKSVLASAAMGLCGLMVPPRT